MKNKLIVLIVLIIILILAITSYIIIKSEETSLLKLIKQQTVQYSDTVRRSVRYSMLENKNEDIKWIIETIGAQENVSEIRVLNKEGRITVSSMAGRAGVLVDTKSEGCISCHKSDKTIDKQPEQTRMYMKENKERFIGVMQPIYNESACFSCHPVSKKILGVLDVVLSLKETDKEIYRNRRMILLFFVITILIISFIVAKFTYDLHNIHKELEISYKKLQEINNIKSVFVRKVAHQLRAPVAAIQSCLKVVLDGYVSADKQLEMINRAEKRTGSLISMINDLLDLAKVEESKSVKQKERVDMNDILKKTIALMKDKADSKKIDLTLNIMNVLPFIFADYNEMEGVITNLVDNAIKYTPDGGKVEVIAKIDKDIKIEIIDSGIGIPNKDLPFVFNEFYRCENATEYEKEGSGLGLTIVKKTVELYNGNIIVDSEINKGTKFTVSFPI